jgi:PAS domain S-box-containing protein
MQPTARRFPQFDIHRDGDETGGMLRWHRPMIVAVRVVVAVSLVLMVFLITRLPIEDMAAAEDSFAVRHGALQQFDRALGLMKLRAGEAVAKDSQAGISAAFEAVLATVRERLHALESTRCARAAVALEDTALQRELGQLVEAYQALLHAGAALPAAAAPGDDLMGRIHERLRELDGNAETCLRLQLDEVAAQGVRIRRQALVLVALLVLAVGGVVALRRNDKAQLRAQLRFSEQLIDAIPLPLSMRSPQGRFVLVNKAFETKHRVIREHLLGQPVSETMPRVDAEAIAQMDARAVVSAEPVDETFEIAGEAGTRHVQVRVHALRRPDNSVAGIVGIQTDVTALRRKEAQLIEINAKLSQLSIKMIDAQEDERRRIARDLHDQVGQILTALKLQLASLARRDRIEVPATAMTTPIDLAEEALRHTRDLSASLHPHLLDDLGIEPALNWLIDRFIRPSVPLIELRCRLEPARGLAAIELVAFRVVQEALTNVVRHAEATRVGVLLEAGDGELSIEVIDDGVGFEAGNTWFDLQRTTSLGVTSMRDRVTEVGGDLHMDSAPDNGTSLRVHLPWRIE